MHYIFKQNLYDVLEYPKSIFNMVFNEMIREINNLINRNRLIHWENNYTITFSQDGLFSFISPVCSLHRIYIQVTLRFFSSKSFYENTNQCHENKYLFTDLLKLNEIPEVVIFRYVSKLFYHIILANFRAKLREEKKIGKDWAIVVLTPLNYFLNLCL